MHGSLQGSLRSSTPALSRSSSIRSQLPLGQQEGQQLAGGQAASAEAEPLGGDAPAMPRGLEEGQAAAAVQHAEAARAGEQAEGAEGGAAPAPGAVERPVPDGASKPGQLPYTYMFAPAQQDPVRALPPARFR
jgi:hypothetical protein